MGVLVDFLKFVVYSLFSAVVGAFFFFKALTTFLPWCETMAYNNFPYEWCDIFQWILYFLCCLLPGALTAILTFLTNWKMPDYDRRYYGSTAGILLVLVLVVIYIFYKNAIYLVAMNPQYLWVVLVGIPAVYLVSYIFMFFNSFSATIIINFFRLFIPEKKTEKNRTK